MKKVVLLILVLIVMGNVAFAGIADWTHIDTDGSDGAVNSISFPPYSIKVNTSFIDSRSFQPRIRIPR